jgi:hypothetical protein
MIMLKLRVRIKKETKKYVTFYLYVNNSQSIMTLNHANFAEYCGLLSRGSVGVPKEKVNIHPDSCFEF